MDSLPTLVDVSHAKSCVFYVGCKHRDRARSATERRRVQRQILDQLKGTEVRENPGRSSVVVLVAAYSVLAV